MTRRTAKLAAVYLLLGLAATWAVAWGSAVICEFDHPYNTIYEVRPRDYWILGDYRAPGGRRSDLVRLVDPDDTEMWLLDPGVSTPPVPNRISAPGPFDRLISLEERGWPLTALACGVEDQNPMETALPELPIGWAWTPVPHVRGRGPRAIACSHTTAWAITLPGKQSTANPAVGAVLLPLLPRWPGLLADTLFYAMLFAGLHQLAAWGRLARRRRHGRCAACGYDLTGIDGVCPECGNG